MGLFCEKVGRVLTGYPVNLMIAVYGNAGTTYEFYLKKMTKLVKTDLLFTCIDILTGGADVLQDTNKVPRLLSEFSL